MNVFNVEPGDVLFVKCLSGNQYRMRVNRFLGRRLFGVARQKVFNSNNWLPEQLRIVGVQNIVAVRRITGKL